MGNPETRPFTRIGGFLFVPGLTACKYVRRVRIKCNLPQITHKIQRNMGRPAGSRNKRTGEFDRLYQKYSRALKFDPLHFLFTIAADRLTDDDGKSVPVDLELRQKTAKELLPYRFSKKTKTEIDVSEGAGPVQLVFDMNNAGEFEIPASATADSTAPVH